MYSSEDLERFYFQYQTEALPHGESLQSFCLQNKVPYNILLASKNDVQDNRYKSQIFAFVKSKARFMYSYNDFERLFLRYKLEGILRVFLLRNFVCPTKCLIPIFQMVQGYPQEDSSRSGFRCSLPGIRNAGKSFANSGIKARIGSSAFLSY